MTLTQEQLDVLNFKVKNGQEWADHAESHFGLEKGTECMLAKVAKNKAEYDDALSAGGYRNRVERDEDERIAHLLTPMEEWKRAMKKQERMGGIDRDTENLITDNPTFTINEYTQTKYDEKVALRATKPEA